MILRDQYNIIYDDESFIFSLENNDTFNGK